MNEYVLSQLSYCPLVWMFCDKWLNNRTNKIHECPLRIVYNYHQCSFEELLETDNSFTIHERNLQKLAVEMFKLNNELTVQLVSENFNFTENQIILDINQKQNWMLILILKNMASNLYQISIQNLEFHIARNKKRYNFSEI